MSADPKKLADELEISRHGLCIMGRSIDGGRELTAEEDALIIAALRSHREANNGTGVCRQCGYTILLREPHGDPPSSLK